MTSDGSPSPEVTIVIATRDRPQELHRVVAAIADSPSSAAYEVIVVDDGSQPRLTLERPLDVTGANVTLLRCDGAGPASARNAGIDAARGWLVLFTDDDTIPRRGWVDAAYAFMRAHRDHVGVEGPTVSPQFDPLYFHSISASARGGFLTCNIGYRRDALREVGGFSELFPFPHAEDLDLGVRITRLGPLGYCESMTVLHPPRAVRLVDQIRCGRVLASDATLYALHPDSYPPARYLSGTGYALALNAKRWGHSAFRDVYAVGRNPWRGLRFLALALGYTFCGVRALVSRAARANGAPASAPESR